MEINQQTSSLHKISSLEESIASYTRELIDSTQYMYKTNKIYEKMLGS